MGILLVLFVVGFLFLIVPLMPRKKSNPFTKLIKEKKRKKQLTKEEEKKLKNGRPNSIQPIKTVQKYKYPEATRRLKERTEKPEIKEGKRGGRYTEDQTKDGRPYRRYF